jgi:VanZ family protein
VIVAIAVSTRARLWLPVVVWALVIFALSSIPSLATGLGTWDLVLRKLAHAAEFAILGALVYRWLGRAPLAVAVASAYAATDELHQAFVPGRAASPVDWAIDTAGALIGVAAYVAYRKRRR